MLFLGSFDNVKYCFLCCHSLWKIYILAWTIPGLPLVLDIFKFEFSVSVEWPFQWLLLYESVLHHSLFYTFFFFWLWILLAIQYFYCSFLFHFYFPHIPVTPKSPTLFCIKICAAFDQTSCFYQPHLGIFVSTFQELHLILTPWLQFVFYYFLFVLFSNIFLFLPFQDIDLFPKFDDWFLYSLFFHKDSLTVFFLLQSRWRSFFFPEIITHASVNLFVQ